MSSFTYPHVISNPYAAIFPIMEHTSPSYFSIYQEFVVTISSSRMTITTPKSKEKKFK